MQLEQEAKGIPDITIQYSTQLLSDYHGEVRWRKIANVAIRNQNSHISEFLLINALNKKPNITLALIEEEYQFPSILYTDVQLVQSSG